MNFTNFKEIKFTYEESSKIEQLKALIQKSNLLIEDDNVYLSRFLVFSNWNVENSLKILNKHFDIKLEIGEPWFATKLPEDYKDLILNSGARYLCPRLDKNGRVIIIFRLVDKFNIFPNYLNDLISVDDLIFDAVLSTENGLRKGIVAIYDMREMSINFLKFGKLENAIKIRKKHEALPIDLIKIHIIHSGGVVNCIIRLLLPRVGVLKEKAIFHKTNFKEKLIDDVGYENLPAEFGGPEEVQLNSQLLYDFLRSAQEPLKKRREYRKILK